MIIEEILPLEVYKKIQNGEDMVVLDIREPHELIDIRMSNALFIPQGHLVSGNGGTYQGVVNILQKNKDREVVVICRSGHRSLFVSDFLLKSGFSNVKSMKTGILGWASQSLPVERGVIQV